MRDPCLARGPDGVFHLVWTTSWRGKTIGHASSRDLIHWSEQQDIPVMAHEPTALNCWAPELAWDPERRHWLIFWATTIPGRFPETANQGDSDYNHRIYATTTREFQTFTPTRLFLDPGFNVIDATVLHDRGRYYLIVKDETRVPVRKHLRWAASDDLEGPWQDFSPPFTRDWVEGPSAIRIGDDVLVYFDAYRDHYYGAVRTRDWRHWEEVSKQMHFPKGMRHGTVIAVSRDMLEPLLALDATTPRTGATNTPTPAPAQTAPGTAFARPFRHPGILHTRAELEFVRSRLEAGAEPWLTAWKELRAHPVAQLDYRPRPRADVVRGPSNHPNIGGNDFLQDGSAAYTHALQWQLTGNREHARKAIEILDAWSATLKSIGGHDARLLTGMAGIHYVNAAELLRHLDGGWDPAAQARFEKMLREVLYPIIRDFYPTANGNWDAAMIQTMLAMGVFLDDHAMFDRAANYYLRGEGNGAIGRYFNAFGECQESGRDQAHTQMGLGYLGCAAEIGWKQGLDLYGAIDNRLLKGYEYTAKYNLGHDVPYEPYRSVAGRYFYKTISPRARGRFLPIWERVYHHYHDRRGLEMPWTRQVIERIRPENWRMNFVPWNTLMCAGQPE
ncbi:MAG: hypothetical protein D6766_13470 [Verrucomicrobia bacterium]|nr:MAG: hypothetical protein D6766_13470 [Verrucomicrobiota bacterium]